MTGGGALFRLVYASRSLVPQAAAAAEIPRILQAARHRNAAQHITGALLFSADAFVQVLEAGPVPARDFAGWSMACAGRRPELRLDGCAAAPDGAPTAMLDLLRGALGRLAGAALPA